MQQQENNSRSFELAKAQLARRHCQIHGRDIECRWRQERKHWVKVNTVQAGPLCEKASPKPRPVRIASGVHRELRMREWPSIVPGAPEDFYIVVNHFGRFGTAFAETDLDRANYETTVADLMSGQHGDPLRVVMFNPDTDRAEDVSHAIAQEILRRLGLEGRSVPSVLEDFIDRHVGKIVS